MVLGHVAAPTVPGREYLAAVTAREGLRYSQVGTTYMILKYKCFYYFEEKKNIGKKIYVISVIGNTFFPVIIFSV